MEASEFFWKMPKVKGGKYLLQLKFCTVFEYKIQLFWLSFKRFRWY